MPSESTIAAVISLAILGLFIWYWSTEYSRMRRWIGTGLTLIVAACALFTIYPNLLSQGFKDANIAQGIDLKGGTKFVIRIDPGTDADGNEISLNESAIADVRRVLNARITEKLQGRNKTITPIGEDMLEIQIPDLDESEYQQVAEELTRPAILNFHLVNSEATNAVNAGQPAPRLHFARPVVPAGTEPDQSTANARRLVIPIQPNVDGIHVKNASASQAPGSVHHQINITLDGEGGSQMIETTRNNVGELLAIVLDGTIISAPSINSPLSRNFQITGDFTEEEATNLARALSNPLRYKVEVVGASNLSATLGQSAIRQGILSGLAALGATLLFLVIFYRFAGLIALFGLTINMLILFGAMAMANQDLTLPGIAGIVLTLGMAVDANVLIYERLKEELRDGKSLKAALQGAYDKAFSAIFDANVTSLITAIVLFTMGSEALKGFAATLTAGIIGTLFCALLVTRTGFRWMTDFNFLKKLSVGKVWKLTNFDFIKKARVAVVVSAVLIVGAIASIAARGDHFLSIDFLGGQRITYKLADDTQMDRDAVETALNQLEMPDDYTIQEQVSPNERYMVINLGLDREDQPEGYVPLIERAKTALAELDFVQASIEANGNPDDASIGASFGKVMLKNSAIALGIGLICIAIYIMIRFQWAYAIGAIMALTHDLIIAMGIMALLKFELNTIMVGAYLTIAGYSINDTIVVFDRIRETLNNDDSKRPNIRQLINLGINSTLSRTLLTSTTTLIAVLILAIFGGPDLRAFSVAILIGVFVGTWSSIFIASPIVYRLIKNKGAEALRDNHDDHPVLAAPNEH